MSRLSRDLGVAGAITAGILLSLILARLLTADPAPVADPTTPTPAASVAGDVVHIGPPTSPAARATTPSTATTASTVGAAPAATAGPAASMVLSSGAQVVPRPARPPQSYRPAPTGLPDTPPQSPADTPDPAVYADPADLATAWLTAMCWYDYRTGPDENIRQAAAYGDTAMPPAGNPWAMDEQAWAQVTAGHLGSGCTSITAVPVHDGIEQDTVTLTATQVLLVDGAPYQAVPISLTRSLEHDPDGRWLIGPAVTAN